MNKTAVLYANYYGIYYLLYQGMNLGGGMFIVCTANKWIKIFKSKK